MTGKLKKVEPKTPKPLEEAKEIKVIERIIENKEIAPQDAFGKLTRSQIQLIKTTIAKGASDDELKLFIQVCKGANLNPFMKQVFLVPRWDTKLGKEVRAIQVSIDGFRAIAEESGVYAGNDDAKFEGDSEIEYGDMKKTKLTVPGKATVSVYKVVDGQRYPFTATARWAEYYPGPKMGFQWHRMPYLMLGKCAEALALRKAFPKLLSGMYAEEELSQREPEQVKAQETAMAANTVVDMIKKMRLDQLDDFMAKLNKSVKYTKEQKQELTLAVEARRAEIKNAEADQESK